jgi:hypothetical protein
VARTRSVLSSLLVGATLAACATVGVEEQVQQARQSWEGATYEDVVARWGPPVRSATPSDGTQVHTWISQETPVYAPGPSVGVGVFGGSRGVGSGVGVGIGFPFGGTVNPAACERMLTFKDGRVVEQNWTGDPGYCRHFNRP